MTLDDAAAMEVFRAFQAVESSDISSIYDTLSSIRFRGRPVAVTVAPCHEEDNPLIGCSDAFVRMTGYTRDAIAGRNCRFMNKDCSIRICVRNDMRIALKTGQPFYGVIRNRRMDNTFFPNLLTMTTVTVG